MLGFSILGAAFLASILAIYVVAAAEEGLWPFHRFRVAPKATKAAMNGGPRRELVMNGSPIARDPLRPGRSAKFRGSD
jgi:hypothetical protein